MLLKILKKISYILAGLIILLAILSSLARFSTPWISHYRPQLEAYATQQLGVPVKIRAIQGGWYYFEPVIRLSHVTIGASENFPETTVENLAVGVNLLSSLWHWSFQPNVFIASHVNMELPPSLFSTNTSFPLKEFTGWVLSRSKVILEDVNIFWTGDIHQPAFTISEGYLKLKRKRNGHRIELQFQWQGSSTLSTSVLASAEFSGESLNYNEWKGRFFVSVNNLNLKEWRERVLPSLPEITHGKNDLQWWGDFENGNVQHNFQWDAQSIKINYPDCFNRPIPFSTLHLKSHWTQEKGVWRMNIERFFVENAHISANTQGYFTWKDHFTDVFTELTSQFALQDLAHIKAYLPDNIMKEKLKVWLHRSIVSGDRTTGKLTLHGFLQDFPFDNMTEDKGVFLVDSYWNHFTLDYKQGWPAAKNMNGHLIFRNRDLIAEIYGGKIDALPLQEVKATILGMGAGTDTLKIEGRLKTDVANAQHFVLHSPLKANLASLKTMRLSGQALFDIGIEIPLYPENDTNLVEGKIHFPDNTFTLSEWWNLNFEHFNGWLNYNQDGIVDSQLKATVLNCPVQLAMKTTESSRAKSKMTQVDFSGQLSTDAIKALFPIFIFDFLEGTTSYQGRLALISDPTQYDTLTLHSDLQGIAVNLPKPFGKTAPQSIPLDLLLKFSGENDTRLSIDYAKQMSIHLGYEKTKEKRYRLKQGKIHVGGLEEEKPLSQGLNIEGSLPEFSWSAWQPFFTRMAKMESKKTVSKEESLSHVLHQVQLKIPKVDWNGEIIRGAVIGAQPQPTYWNVDIVSDKIIGNFQLSLPLAKGIRGHLKSLVLPSSSKNNQTTAFPDWVPNDIPPLQLTIDKLRYKNMSLGKATVETQSNVTENELIIKKLNLQTSASTLNLTGNWIKSANTVKSRLVGTLTSTDVAGTLRDLDIVPVVQGKEGLLSFDLTWPASLSRFNKKDLSGSASVTIAHGVITHLSKEMQAKVGLGKLVSFLSLQSLARRFIMDFGDLPSKGLNFDTLKGSFALNKGMMTTKDSYLNGSIAYIDMQGSIDLGAELYHLILHIAPHEASTIPVIATLAGGPVVGLATFAASTLIHQGMKHTSLYTYQIEGPWKDPKIQALSVKKE